MQTKPVDFDQHQHYFAPPQPEDYLNSVIHEPLDTMGGSDLRLLRFSYALERAYDHYASLRFRSWLRHALGLNVLFYIGFLIWLLLTLGNKIPLALETELLIAAIVLSLAGFGLTFTKARLQMIQHVLSSGFVLLTGLAAVLVYVRFSQGSDVWGVLFSNETLLGTTISLRLSFRRALPVLGAVIAINLVTYFMTLGAIPPFIGAQLLTALFFALLTGYLIEYDSRRDFLNRAILHREQTRITQIRNRLETEVAERQRVEQELRRLATTDALTGAFNRRHFFDLARAEFARAVRYKAQLSVIMMDIDHFKQINDRHGHAAGDAALKRFATLGLEHIRAQDRLGRLGGEEFAIFLPETSVRAAFQLAERFRVLCSQTAISSEQQTITFTVSIGVASLQSTDTNFAGLLDRADKSLYRAKETGRNRVSTTELLPPEAASLLDVSVP